MESNGEPRDPQQHATASPGSAASYEGADAQRRGLSTGVITAMVVSMVVLVLAAGIVLTLVFIFPLGEPKDDAGDKIAFGRCDDGDDYPEHDLYVMNADGSDAESLDSRACDPVGWSPDSDRLSYNSGEDCTGGPVKVCGER